MWTEKVILDFDMVMNLLKLIYGFITDSLTLYKFYLDQFMDVEYFYEFNTNSITNTFQL